MKKCICICNFYEAFWKKVMQNNLPSFSHERWQIWNTWQFKGRGHAKRKKNWRESTISWGKNSWDYIIAAATKHTSWILFMGSTLNWQNGVKLFLKENCLWSIHWIFVTKEPAINYKITTTNTSFQFNVFQNTNCAVSF